MQFKALNIGSNETPKARSTSSLNPDRRSLTRRVGGGGRISPTLKPQLSLVYAHSDRPHPIIAGNLCFDFGVSGAELLINVYVTEVKCLHSYSYILKLVYYTYLLVELVLLTTGKLANI